MGFILLASPYSGDYYYLILNYLIHCLKKMQKALDKVNGIMGEYLAGIQ